MNEVLFYVGIVFSVSSFILTIVIFIRENIIEATRYYFKIQNKKKKDNKTVKPTLKRVSEEISRDETMLLDGEDTEILRIAKNYATTLLSVEDSTGILEDYNEEFNNHNIKGEK